MAAIQKIRSYGPWLIAVIGLALFAFVAGDLFKWFEQRAGVSRMQVGSVYGEDLSIQDFQDDVETFTNVVKMQRQLSGQDANIGDADQEGIRSYLWQQHVQNSIIRHEAAKLGLYISDEEVQQALRDGQAGSLRMISMYLSGNPQAPFNLQLLQDFLKNKDKYMQQALQQGGGEQAELIQTIGQVWTFTEKQLRDELLQQKYYYFLMQSFGSNPTLAKFEFENNVSLTDALVAALPYSTVADTDVKVTDADLQAAYEQYKERFFIPVDTRDVKFVDVAVTASAADRQAITAEVEDAYRQLGEGTDPAAVVSRSKSRVQYTALPLRRKVFEDAARDVASRFDSVSVGGTINPYVDAQTNTVTTFKLIARQQLPDSILYRGIVAQAQSSEESAKRADSIFNALQGGAAYKAVAEKYGQKSDSIWLTSEQFETLGMSDDNVQLFSTLYELQPGGRKVIKMGDLSLVVEVLDKRAPVEKFQVAVVRRDIDFSKATYNQEKNKLNRFLADNKTPESIEKNAGKNGYVVTPVYAASGSALLSNLRQQIGGSAVKDFAVWAFDNAEIGQVSQLYEVGAHGDHLLVGMVTGANKEGYLPWNSPAVKDFLTGVVRQQKKSEKLMAQVKGVKTFEAAQAIAGVVTDSVNGSTFGSPVMVPGVGTQELLLSAVLAKANKGQFVGPFAGTGAIFFAQVTDKRKADEKYDEAQMLQQLAQQDLQSIIMSNPFSGQVSHILLSALELKADVVDNRYKF